MKSYNFIIIILIVFFKTGNVLSKESIFNVNNIELVKKENLSNQKLANKAIEKGFIELKDKLFLEEDAKKLSQLSLSQIKDLVLYYQVISEAENNKKDEKIIYNIFFDKEKLHELFFKEGIFYSEIIKKELYLLPILKIKNDIYLYNNNFFYENWSEVSESELIEFILPVENIETVRVVNSKKDNLLELSLDSLFKEYPEENLSYILINLTGSGQEKIFIKTKILGKEINKSLTVKRSDLPDKDFYNRVIQDVKSELTNIIKSQNLIDVRTPSFINTKLIINKDNNLVELNRRLKKIDLVDNIYVQELNNEYILLKIKYLGKLNKIINQLENQKIILKFQNDQWNLSMKK